MQRFATTTAAATCNTLIDPVRVNSFARTNEAISTSTSFLFFTYLTSSFFAYHDLLISVRVTDIYVVHCANAKYVGRNFLFAQRFSNSLPAFRTFTWANDDELFSRKNGRFAEIVINNESIKMIIFIKWTRSNPFIYIFFSWFSFDAFVILSLANPQLWTC